MHRKIIPCINFRCFVHLLSERILIMFQNKRHLPAEGLFEELPRKTEKAKHVLQGTSSKTVSH